MRILDLHVQPGASRSEFAGRHGERIKLRLAAPAADGKANAALVEFLAGHYGVPRRSGRRKGRVIRLKSGAIGASGLIHENATCTNTTNTRM